MPSRLLPSADLRRLIHIIRGQRVILDADLAALYAVSTKALNQAVKRNRERFPNNFVFQLEADEVLRSQIVTSKIGRGGRRYLPYAFTEHGALMAANVLNSRHAVKMSIYVIEAFVKMRSLLIEHRDLARELATLERKLTQRLDTHETAIVDVLRRIMRLLDPSPQPDPPRRRIGFGAPRDQD